MTLRGLQGLLSSVEQDMVRESMFLRFKDHTKFKTPEALIIYEQRLLDNETLLDLCSVEYGMQLEIPKISYLPKEILSHFSKFSCIPLKYDTLNGVIHVGVVPELATHIEPFSHTETEVHYVPIHYFVEQYTNMYSSPEFLYRIPDMDLFKFIVQEAVDLGASDITIVAMRTKADLFYNVRKKKVYGKRMLGKNEISEISNLICTKAGNPRIMGNRDPKFVGIDLDENHRGRVAITNTYYGDEISIRVFSNEIFETTLEELNLDDKTIKFIRDKFISQEPGLRLLIGATASGKNTTILAALNEMLSNDVFKAVSAEMPVENLVDRIIAHDCSSEEEYRKVVQSFIRQNPDIVYMTEMTDLTALEILKNVNTGKVAFSSIHSNSIASTIARIQDITGQSADRIIMNLHSCILQKLVRIEEEDRLQPITKCLFFSEELKARLIGKSIGEIYLILSEEEEKW
jgi:Tfp pilus assembly pilus retraction ATPase PilT